MPNKSYELELRHLELKIDNLRAEIARKDAALKQLANESLYLGVVFAKGYEPWVFAQKALEPRS